MNKKRTIQGRQLIAESEDGERVLIQQSISQTKVRAMAQTGDRWVSGMKSYRRTDNGHHVNVVGEEPMVFEDIYDQTHFGELAQPSLSRI